MTSRPAVAKHLRELVRLRRVRDRIDREYEQPLDVEALERRTIAEVMACSTGASTPVSRSSSSGATRPSWRTPTGSATSTSAPATTAAGSLRGDTRGPRRRPLHPHRRALAAYLGA